MSGWNGRRRPVLLDAAGARNRREMQDEIWHDKEKQSEAFRTRVAKAAGKIPVLESIEEVSEYASYFDGDLFNRGRSIQFPALQLARRLKTKDVFAALPQNLGKQAPNIRAHRVDEGNVGPHFDNYSNGCMPWTLHENLKGEGIIRATFLPKAQHQAYEALAKSLPDTDETQELLAHNRAAIGGMVIASSRSVYVGPIEPGTRTLIWHGSSVHPPAVHEIVREDLGSYRIFAHQQRGELGEGFVRI